MKDNKIIKALECCSDTDCDNCPFEEQCRRNGSLSDIALDLINRQNAEIERLQKHSKEVAENCTQLLRLNDKETNKRFLEAIEVVKSKAIKEFAERLKGCRVIQTSNMSGYIDNLVKEMVGETNAK